MTPGPPELISSDANLDPLAFLGGLIDHHGHAVRYQTRFGPCLFFAHPDHVQHILQHDLYRRASLVKMALGDGLLASDGPHWKSQRRLMQRDFLPRNISPFVTTMGTETATLAAAWRNAARAGTTVDVTTDMTRLTLHIVVRTLFSNDLSPQSAASLCNAVTQVINELGKISWTIFGVPVSITPAGNANFSAARKLIDDLCHEMIARRRALAPGDRPPDLLTLLIGAETAHGQMSDLQLRDEMVTMLVGGHETTALALAWAWKALAEHPEVEARLIDELHTVLGGRPPGLEDVPRLRWTRAIFDETCRLFPPVWYMARVATADDVIDGHAVPRGASILISAWFTHRHQEFWSDAERFDPERFRDRPQPAHQYAYFPFGGGRHRCLGVHFALLEAVVILAQLAQQFQVRPVNAAGIRPHPGITLRQQPGMSAEIAQR